jgi:hypothetical protein
LTPDAKNCQNQRASQLSNDLNLCSCFDMGRDAVFLQHGLDLAETRIMRDPCGGESTILVMIGPCEGQPQFPIVAIPDSESSVVTRK